MPPSRRLIEAAFPLRQASLDSVHEKSVRHGHISTLHVWPARRPLAASRAALLATLLPDPGTPEARDKLLLRIGGTVERVRVDNPRDGTSVDKEVTKGGVLHWGNETSPAFDALRAEVRAAFGGRGPRMLDPFSGGGAIPFEAMRLGCEVTAVDINPVAWLLLKCTLEYPQKLASEKRPLPEAARGSAAFMALYDAAGRKGAKKGGRNAHEGQQSLFAAPEAGLAWHVRAWGQWVLDRARAELERLYPTIDGKPTVAYLWARTVACKNPKCRVTIPLLKTRWLCKKAGKHVLLTMSPDAEQKAVVFGVERVAVKKRDDLRRGDGTMSKAGAKCPCCGAIMTLDEVRDEGRAGRVGAVMTAVVVDGQGKEYRLPHPSELEGAEAAGREGARVAQEIPLGFPREPINTGSIKKGGVSITRWGVTRWDQVFSDRQRVALATFVKHTRAVAEAMAKEGYSAPWIEAVAAYLALTMDRLADYSSMVSTWNIPGEKLRNTFARFALPFVWDFAEVMPFADTSGGYPGALEWVALVAEHTTASSKDAPPPKVLRESAIMTRGAKFDVIVTDPPYYDAIPYADLMDFFYVWLRRTLTGRIAGADAVLSLEATPKWDHATNDGELIEDESRYGGDSAKAKAAYEDGMFRAFRSAHDALEADGRFVVVFANKSADAWETLVSAIIRAGFVVTASWPIQTERAARSRALSSAALSSSVWIVCKKRGPLGPGWEKAVIDEMRERMHGRYDAASKTWAVEPRLQQYWDAGIRGPDFVWASIGPALEAYSRYPAVRRVSSASPMGVSDFLQEVRRLVVDYVVGRVLSRDDAAGGGGSLDDLSNYYLLHRNDFGMGDAPAGASILYAVSCNLSDRQLTDHHDLLVRSGADDDADDEEGEDDAADDDDAASAGSAKGNTVRLKAWDARRAKSLGQRRGSEAVPLIDQVHRLMQLWDKGEEALVDAYLDEMELRTHAMFPRFLQALIELAPGGSRERALLESVSNHLAKKGFVRTAAVGELALGERGDDEEGR